MLSFMKDGQDDSNVPGENIGIDGAENASSVTQPDYLTTAEHGKNLKQSTIILAVLFTVGALCMWFMIKKVAPQEADAAMSTEEAKIELAIAELTGMQSDQNQIDNIVKRFYNFSDIEQINVSDLKKNPFSHEIAVGNINKIVDPGRSVLTKEVVRKSKGLQLWSIMGSTQGGCCMINEKILYKGDVINGFTVTKIDPRFVVLESEGIPVTLKMSE